MKTIKSNYAVIDDNTIYLHDIKPNIFPAFQTLLQDAEIIFNEFGYIEISGKEIVYDLSFDGFYYTNQDVHEDYIKMKFDLFSFKKKPYVKSGWFRTKKLSDFKQILKSVNTNFFSV